MRTKNASVSYSKNGNDEYHAEEAMIEHCGSPKATQETPKVPAIKTMVNVKEFPHQKLTVKSSLLDFQKLMKEKLCDHIEVLEELRRDYPFGAFLDVQFVPPPAMLWQLMVREANVEGEKGSEMWFVVNGVPIRYSLMEFSLITGLNCSELAYGYEEMYDSTSLHVFIEENWGKSVVCYTSVVERFSKLCWLLNEKGDKEYALQWIVKVATLMFVVIVLIGHAKKDAPVPKWILAKVDVDSKAFSWGTWAFLESIRIQSLGKDLVSEKKKLVKGGKTTNTLRYTGFVLPASFLLFECVPDFGESFGVKREQQNPALPRMCLWENNISKKPSHEAIVHAINTSKSIRSILLPEGSEIRAPWITSLTSLACVSNPTLREFVRRLQGGEKDIQTCMKEQLVPQASEDEHQVTAGRNSSLDEVPSSSEDTESEVPSKKYEFRKREIPRLSTPTFSLKKHIPLFEKPSPLLERSKTNGKASSFSGNASEKLPDSLKDYIDGKFSELQKMLCKEVEMVLERKFQKLEKSFLRTLLDNLKGKSDGGKEEDEPVAVNMVDRSNFEGIAETKFEEEKELKAGSPTIQEEEEGDPDHAERMSALQGERYNEEEEMKDGSPTIKEDGVGDQSNHAEDGMSPEQGERYNVDQPAEVNMVDLSRVIDEEEEEEEEEEIKDEEEEIKEEEEEIKDENPPIQQKEEERFTFEREALEDEMAISNKIVHDVVGFCKSTENHVDENLESNGEDFRELEAEDEVDGAWELGRGLREKKRSIHVSSPYMAVGKVYKRLKSMNDSRPKELDKAEEAQLDKRRNPSSQQLEAFHHFLHSAIADGREVQCILEKRGDSHGIVKKYWSSLINAGGWLETSHTEEIMFYFMQMYNKKDSTYAVLPECFQMINEVNAESDLFPMVETGLIDIVEGTHLGKPCSKAWKGISCVYWVHNISDHWVAIRSEFERKCLVVFNSLQRITTMSKLEEKLSKMRKMLPVICNYASLHLKGIPGDHLDIYAQWNIERPNVPQQTNSDCGVFALKFLELAVQDLEPSMVSTITKTEVLQLRKAYSYAICREDF